ncbi:hypothetical protein BN1723_019417, partial [Verticillium longisporum]
FPWRRPHQPSFRRAPIVCRRPQSQQEGPRVGCR